MLDNREKIKNTAMFLANITVFTFIAKQAKLPYCFATSLMIAVASSVIFTSSLTGIRSFVV